MEILYCITIAASSPPSLVFFLLHSISVSVLWTRAHLVSLCSTSVRPHDVEKQATVDVNEVVSEFLNRSDASFQSDRLLYFLSLKFVVQCPSERESGK